MEKQLPLFAYELTASAQQTIPARRLPPAAQYVTGYVFS